MLSAYKPKLNPLILIISKPFLKLSPNVISIIGVIPPILFFGFLVGGLSRCAFLSLFLFIFDAIDGAVARQTGQVTKFGGLLDSTLDRFADALLITAFSFAMIVPWSITIPTLISAYLTSYVRSRAELAGDGKIKLDIGIIERTERIIVIGIATLLWLFSKENIIFDLNISSLIFVFLGLLSFITVIQRLTVASRLLNK